MREIKHGLRIKSATTKIKKTATHSIAARSRPLCANSTFASEPDPEFTPHPVLAGPVMTRKSGIRASDCLSAASSSSTPAFSGQHRSPEAKRRDPDSRVAFSLLTLFWRSKRQVSCRRATPASQPKQRKPRDELTDSAGNKTWIADQVRNVKNKENRYSFNSCSGPPPMRKQHFCLRTRSRIHAPPRSGWACDDQQKRDQGERLSERSEFELDPRFFWATPASQPKQRNPRDELIDSAGSNAWIADQVRNDRNT